MNSESQHKTFGPMGPGRFAPSPALDRDEALIVDVGGFEGPLDLLLELARPQKIDLAQISILALAEQYLAFIERCPHVAP